MSSVSPRRRVKKKKRARDAKLAEQAKNEQMMKMYREHVLGEKPQADVVPLGAIKPAAKPSKEEEAVGSFGD